MSDSFAQVDFRPKRHAQIMKMPRATRRYAMFFTPRSGSSRITELAEKSGVLGRPAEHFNPEFMPRMAQALSAADLADFVTLLTHRFNGKGTFGCQITYAQLVRSFGTEERFLDLVRPDSHIWLIREDIVAQAVSVSRMVQTSIAHAPGVSAEELERANRDFVYNAREIASYIWRIRWMEQRTEAMFARHGIRPLRLSYDYLATTRPRRFMKRIAAHVGAKPLPDKGFKSTHKKIAGPKNNEFAERFRSERPRLIARLERERARMLAAFAEGEGR